MPINSFLYPGAKVTLGYEVANSCRFNDGDSAFLSKTLGTGTNTTKLTVSVWIKRSTLGTEQQIFETWNDNNNRFDILFKSSTDQLEIQNTLSGSTTINLKTNRVFRDPSAWMNIVVIVDSTQSTASNRVKLYINGTQETSFATETYLNEDANLALGTSSYTNFIGKYSSSGGNFFDGYMCEVVYLDGTAASIGDLGEFDEDSPTIWKPKDVSGLTFGNNGAYLDFEDSSNLGNDANGGTDYGETNLAATDQATDTCTNNFCTLNPLYNIEGSYTLSEGNTIFTATGANDGTLGTIAVSSGKWYFEAEFDSVKEACYAGFADVELINNIGAGNPITSFIGQYRDDYAIQIGGSNDGAYTDVANGDIFGFAINLDAASGSKTVVIQKNGTTTDTVTIPTANENNFFIPVVGDTTGGDPSGILKCNFGGSPAVAPSSAVADANGFGSFEYNPTIGGVDYLAICTKNLAENG